jgi:hypothetical protein
LFPLFDVVLAIVFYCTGTTSKSVVLDSVVVSKITIVIAVAKRKASIVFAIQTPTIATA